MYKFRRSPDRQAGRQAGRQVLFSVPSMKQPASQTPEEGKLERNMSISLSSTPDALSDEPETHKKFSFKHTSETISRSDRALVVGVDVGVNIDRHISVTERWLALRLL